MVGYETLAKRYATAVFAIAQADGTTDAVGRDLRSLADALSADADVRRFFLSPVVDRGEKEKSLASVFTGKVGDTALHTLLLLVRKRREAILTPLADAYDALVLAGSGKERVTITSARPLAQPDLDGIVASLGKRYGSSYLVETAVDPSLLGGIRIAIGDRVIDGSLSGRIDDLARDLLAAPV